MPKKKITTVDFETTVMKKVNTNEITMKPRWHFILGSVFMMIGFIGVTIVAVYLLNLLFFLLKPHGPMGEWRLAQILSSFPWWLPFLIAATMGVGVWLLKKYEFSYKRNQALIIVGFIIAIFVAALLLDITGLNTIWFRRGPMQRYNQRHY